MELPSVTLREWLCSASSSMVMRVGRPSYQREMQFIYTSSHEGQGKYTAFTKLATCTRWITYAKIKISRPQDSVSPLPPPPMTPACGNARRVAPGHAGGSDAWKEKPPAMEISTEPPTHTQTHDRIQGGRHLARVGRMGIETHTACC